MKNYGRDLLSALSIAAILVFTSESLLIAQESANQQPVSAMDVEDLVRECQRTLHSKGYGGVVWWIPAEFWEASAGQGNPSTKALVEAMRRYTLVAVLVGKTGPLGVPTWVPGAMIRAQTLLRDSAGNEYAPLSTLSTEAQMLEGVARPLFANILGKTGENLGMLFFPGNNKAGQRLADPGNRGEFSVVLTDLAGPGQRVYTYRLPLTSLSPAKFCPVGKEKVQADWLYCPWHGVSLSAPAADVQEQKPAVSQAPRIRVGGQVQAKRLVSNPPPAYPPVARMARIQGTVRLEAIIGKDGTVQDLKVIEGHPLLVPAALDAVKQWRYEPTLLNGEPVEVDTEIDVNFVLQG